MMNDLQSGADNPSRVNPFFSVVIVNYNAGAMLTRVMSALSGQTYPHFEVIVIDNNSQDHSWHATENLPFPCRLVRLQENTGFAVSNNLAGKEHAKGNWLFLLNPDAFPAHGVRRRDEPADPAADGGLGRMSATNLDVKGANAVAGWLAAAETRASAAHEPEWMLKRRRHAAQVAASMPFPSREDELWRRSDFSALPIDSLDANASPPRARNVDDLPAAVVERLAGEAANAALLVQRDGDVVLEQTHPTLQKQGVVVCSMERAIREHAGLLQEHFGAQLATDYDRWVAIGEALRTGGVFVHVPKGVHAELPERLFQWIDGGRRLVAPRTVISVGEQGSLTVLDEMLSESAEEPSLHAGGIELSVGRGGKLTFASLQDWSRNVFHYGNARAQVGADAELQWIQVMVGGRMNKQHIRFDIAGQGAQACVHGVMFGDHRPTHSISAGLTAKTWANALRIFRRGAGFAPFSIALK